MIPPSQPSQPAHPLISRSWIFLIDGRATFFGPVEFLVDILATEVDFRFYTKTTRTHVDHGGEKVAKRRLTGTCGTCGSDFLDRVYLLLLSLIPTKSSLYWNLHDFYGGCSLPRSFLVSLFFCLQLNALTTTTSTPNLVQNGQFLVVVTAFCLFVLYLELIELSLTDSIIVVVSVLGWGPWYRQHHSILFRGWNWNHGPVHHLHACFV